MGPKRTKNRQKNSQESCVIAEFPWNLEGKTDLVCKSLHDIFPNRLHILAKRLLAPTRRQIPQGSSVALTWLGLAGRPFSFHHSCRLAAFIVSLLLCSLFCFLARRPSTLGAEMTKLPSETGGSALYCCAVSVLLGQSIHGAPPSQGKRSHALMEGLKRTRLW